MSARILSCPRCGGRGLIFTRFAPFGSDVRLKRVKCVVCGHASAGYSDKASAVAAWNIFHQEVAAMVAEEAR